MTFSPAPEALRIARALPPGLCDHCLGRRFARVQEATNEERGRAVRRALEEAGERIAPAPRCPWCDGVFEELDAIASAAVRRMVSYEFSTFLVGSRQEPGLIELEKRLGYPEHLKAEVNRELGKRIEALTGKTPDFESPEVTVLLDISFGSLELQVAPLFIYGRYRKLERGIPQTRWPCRACLGRGCARCGGTGKMYQTSVEELIAGPVMRVTEGRDHALHGMGREDIDALMLGEGRPFVLEIREPARRTRDLESLEREINALASGRVEVRGLRPSSMSEVRRIKGSRAWKTYIALVDFSSPPPEEKLKLLERTFTGLQVQQRTPERVSHRRADLDRARRVLELRVEGQDRLRIKAEAGLYIKELISGDGGRTRPSVSEALGVRCSVRALDVVETGGEGDGEGVEGVQGEDEADPESQA